MDYNSYKDLSSADVLTVQHILACGGYKMDENNFTSEDQRKKFYDKFPSMERFFEETKRLNPTGEQGKGRAAQAIRTQIVKDALAKEVFFRAAEILTDHGAVQKGTHTIAERFLKNRVSDKGGQFVIVAARQGQGMAADVILPKGAQEGGIVRIPGREDQPYFMSPDEVATKGTILREGGVVIPNDQPKYDRQAIKDFVMNTVGAKYVRFYETAGPLKYNPDDAYFEEKNIIPAKVERGRDGKLQVKMTDFHPEWSVRDKAKRATQRGTSRVKDTSLDIGQIADVRIRKRGEGYGVQVSLKDGRETAYRSISEKQYRRYLASQNKELEGKIIACNVFPDFLGQKYLTDEGVLEQMQVKMTPTLQERIFNQKDREDGHINGLFLHKEGKYLEARGEDAQMLSDITGIRVYGKRNPICRFQESKLNGLLPDLVDGRGGVVVLTEGKRPKMWGEDFTTVEYRVNHFERNWDLSSDRRRCVPIQFPNGQRLVAYRQGAQGRALSIGVERDGLLTPVVDCVTVVDWRKSVKENVEEAMRNAIRICPDLGVKAVTLSHSNGLHRK